MKNKIIGVDLDEVLAELLDFVLEYNNHHIGSYKIDRNEIKDYYIHKIEELNIKPLEAIDWFRKPMLDDINNLKMLPVIGAKNRLLELKNNGHKLIIITARIEEIFGEYTNVWIEAHFPNIFDKIVFADHFHENHKEKSELCLDYGVEYMIEDNLDYATDIANVGIKTYLLEKPWNNWQENIHENIVRIDNWDKFMK